MRASVAVFTYERGPLANLEALARLAPGAELLLVDASTSEARCREVERRADETGFRVLPTPGLGLAAQRNAAVRAARAERIAFLDDDCLPRAGWLDALLRALEDADAATARVVTPPELAGPYARFFDQDHGPRARTFTRADLRVLPSRPFDAYAADSSVAPWAVGTGSSFAFLKDAARRVGGFREDLGVGSPAMSGEDIDFFFRLLDAGGRIRYAADAVVEHHHVRREAGDFLRTAHAYARGGREFLRRSLPRKPGYLLVLLGRPVQLALIAARYRAQGDRATAAMCRSAIRGWVGLRPARS